MASSLAAQLGSLTLSGPNAPPPGSPFIKRPGFGTAGQRIKIRVNGFEIRPADMICYHYDVKIGPSDERRPARLNRQIWRYLVATQDPFQGAAVAYDGRAMAFSPRSLPPQGRWEINLPESDGTTSQANRFTVTLTLAREIHLGALRTFISGSRNAAGVTEAAVMSAIQALNVVIQHGPHLTNPSHGPSFFLRGDNPYMAQGIECWRGYFTSLRPGIGRAFVNLDLSSQAFFQAGDLPHVMLELIKLDTRNVELRQLGSIPGPVGIKLSRTIKGLRIERTVPDRDGKKPKRKIKELVSSSASKATFTLENGRTTNVAEYFLKQYGVRLQHPDWPCVRISRHGLWPIELCVVEVGQKYGKKLNPQQTMDILRFTTIKPRERLGMIQQSVQHIYPTNNPAAMQAFQQWQLQLNPRPIELEARVLPPPAVSYAGQNPIRPLEGAWNLKGQRLAKPVQIERWVVFVFASQRDLPLQQAQQSIDSLAQALRALGVGVSDSKPQIHYTPSQLRPIDDDVSSFIRSKVRPPNAGPSFQPPQLLVCYLPTKPNPFYATIKRFGDKTVGVATQCLNIPKVRRADLQYYGNVSLKINVKLGGTNASATLGSIVSKPTIIFGADVSHAAPGSVEPSIAGVVASMDQRITKYASRVSVQRSRQEHIEELAQMVYGLLSDFRENVKVKPEQLIFFRDGLSEGQFPQALHHELNAIRLACQKLDPTFKPKITYIVCAKRHHISMYPADGQGSDRTGNVKAGTTLDQGITSPFLFDWYCQSHGSLLGTSRSAHYTVLADDARFSADQLQQLVYNLCYTFQRATRSVSQVTPCYLADLLCARGSLLLGGDSDDTASVVSGRSGQMEQQAASMLAEYRSRLTSSGPSLIHPNHATNLFFM
ncbi:hypothetical protein JCM10207_007275 [Rhodosporidiobolus poonsookiae]